jgi:hypothetical protein
MEYVVIGTLILQSVSIVISSLLHFRIQSKCTKNEHVFSCMKNKEEKEIPLQPVSEIINLQRYRKSI